MNRTEPFASAIIRLASAYRKGLVPVMGYDDFRAAEARKQRIARGIVLGFCIAWSVAVFTILAFL